MGWLAIGVVALVFSIFGSLGVSSAVASGGAITQFPLPGACCAGDAPTSIVTAADGNLWFTENGGLGRMTPDGQLAQFTEGGLGSVSGRQLATSSDDLWFTANQGIWRITLSGVATEFAPSLTTGGLAPAPDGGIWFSYADISGNASGIARLSPSGAVTPVSDVSAGDLLAGPSGNLWFTTTHGVGTITPAGEVRIFTRGFGGEQVTSLTIGPGGKVWFVSNLGGPSSVIGSVSSTGKVSVLSNHVPGVLADLTKGPDGSLWSTNLGGTVDRITPSGELTVFERGIPQGDITSLGSQPTGITTGPDGNIWFTELGDLANHVPAAIGRVRINALVSVTTKQARVSSSGSATIKLVCGRGVSGRCAGSLTLFHRTVEPEASCNACIRVKITSLSHPHHFSIKPGRSASVKVSLTGTGRRLLDAAKRHQLSAVAQASILPSTTQAPLQLTA